MNLVGKIFVVFIFVMACVFMAFAMAVYTAQRNWRDEVMRPQNEVAGNKELGLKYQLETVQARQRRAEDRERSDRRGNLPPRRPPEQRP